jgi:4-amino-4-deoxy-L-arabinose transferase-like glycosyltransferase
MAKLKRNGDPPAILAAPSGSGWRDAGSAFWPGAVLAAALLLPFLGKAHAVDDVTFLLQAQHLLRDPLHPTAFEMVADGVPIRLSGSLVSGPVAAYLLVPSVLLGGAEWAAHLVSLMLVLLAILATVRITLRLGSRMQDARLAGLLLASTPAVIGMATTSMADIPAMSFGVIAMERWLAWREERRWPQGIVASLTFALAVLSRAHLLMLLPVAMLAALATLNRDSLGRARWRAWVPLLCSVAIVLAVSALTADPASAKGDLLSTTAARFRVDRIAAKLAAFTSHWVLVLPLALPWLFARWRPMSRNPWLWLVGLVAGIVFCSGAQPAMPLVMAPIGVLGAMVLSDVLLDAAGRADREQLWLGAWLLLAVTTFAYVHVPPKYLVPSAPAAALLIARLLCRPDGRAHRAIGGVTVTAGAVLGVLIVLADSEFTDVGRRVARELIAPRVRSGERVWYSGAWGSQWYAMQAGAKPLPDATQFLGSGDIIVTSEYTGGITPRASASIEALESLHVVSRFGRVMSPKDGAGFYSNWFGYLPWSWRNGEIEAVTVWRVR